MSFLERGKALGVEAGKAENALFRFALEFCHETIRGNVSSELADEAWIAFDQGRHAGREQKWPGKPASFRVQASKLRQFAKVGERIGSEGHTLLAKLPSLIGDPTKYYGIYSIAVNVCREMLKRGRTLSEQDVRNLYP